MVGMLLQMQGHIYVQVEAGTAPMEVCIKVGIIVTEELQQPGVC
jgi:hypothetical protein